MMTNSIRQQTTSETRYGSWKLVYLKLCVCGKVSNFGGRARRTAKSQGRQLVDAFAGGCMNTDAGEAGKGLMEVGMKMAVCICISRDG